MAFSDSNMAESEIPMLGIMIVHNKGCNNSIPEMYNSQFIVEEKPDGFRNLFSTAWENFPEDSCGLDTTFKFVDISSWERDKNYKVLFRINATDLIDSISFYLPECIDATEDNEVTFKLNSSINNLIVFPNPCNNVLYVDMKKKNSNNKCKISIINTSGKIVYNGLFQLRKCEPIVLPVNNLLSGMYFLKLYDKDKSYSRIFIKE
ncbi:T9SS type A sorting domain-containing protein [Bacteroidota bacterium]